MLIAGTTVVISLLGLFLMGLPYLYGAALATIVSVLVVMAASVTLVPALMAIAGTRIDRLRIPGTNRAAGRPGRGAGRALGPRRPAPAVGRGGRRRRSCCSCSPRPFAGLRLGFPDRGNDAADTTTRQAYDLVSQGFGPGANGPLLLAAETRGRADRDAMAALADRPARRARRRRGRRAGGRARTATPPCSP